MKYYLPSRDECQKLAQVSEVFYCQNFTINGYLVEIYNYRLANYSDFKDNNAWELRGLTFVQDKNLEWHRHTLMNKFFNLNQTPGWMLEDVKDKKVVRVQDKLDGSIINPIKFPDGSIRMKSKMSFDSEQAIMAQEIFENNTNLQEFIRDCYEDDLMPIFELVSPKNQIVLSYQNTELRLIQMRYTQTGIYESKEFMKSVAKEYNLSLAQDFHIVTGENSKPVLEDLMQRAETEENIEGWVVTLEDGQMIKIKTKWYLALHGLATEGTRENLLVETILDDRIDDVIAMLPEGEKKDFIIETTEKVQHKFNHLVTEYKFLRGQYFNKFQENRKEFALKYKEHALFGYVMKKLNTSFRDIEEIAESQVKQYILNCTKTLTDAKAWLEKI